MNKKSFAFSIVVLAMSASSFAAEPPKPAPLAPATAEVAKPAAEAVPKRPANLQTVSMIVKDLIPFDGGVVIKPEGGGKALI
ncbi:MAG: hypothetical protein AAB250_04765, partial [Bdellovibrionota bacterium]